ncbi:hypothetical protein BGW36DRAFT_428471 [Talaromyces proteolyticus]|uniref:NAD(P)-binding domain-containing protein n=1 Tax=Talaromyces proteolyticus TaxID=1131652 RepID=A0AAD4KN36_9EURO|nr:uncharacterized protein BGW36DRAFT_428471 [Talaromyces proteolyticus]KAH8696462.1 hypothetical protein BGW36DRAFT_428471 [Talaromyces proteolyticus]
MYSHILLFGATGAAGSLFAKFALRKNYKLTIYVRNPGKVDPDIASHKNVTVITGELSDQSKLLEAVKTGVDSVVLLVGGDMSTKGTPLLDGIKTLYPILIAQNVKRVIVLSTPSYSDPKDKTNLFFWFGVRALWYLARDQQLQVIGLATHTISQSLEQLEWTVIRIPMLTNHSAMPVYAGYVGDGRAKSKLSRQSLAQWCLEELEAKNWVGKAPFLSNK